MSAVSRTGTAVGLRLVLVWSCVVSSAARAQEQPGPPVIPGPAVAVLDSDLDARALGEGVELHPAARRPVTTPGALRDLADLELLTAEGEGLRLGRGDRARLREARARWEGLAPSRVRALAQELDLLRESMHGTAMAGLIRRAAPGATLVGVPYSALQAPGEGSLPIEALGLSKVFAARRAQARELASWLEARNVRLVNVSLQLLPEGLASSLRASYPNADPRQIEDATRSILGYEAGVLRTLVDAMPEALFLLAAGNAGETNPRGSLAVALGGRANVLRVGVLDGSGRRLAPISNRGPEAADVAYAGAARGLPAPGGEVLELVRPSTSAATAGVTALAFELLEVRPTLGAAELKALLLRSTSTPRRLRGLTRAGRLEASQARANVGRERVAPARGSLGVLGRLRGTLGRAGRRTLDRTRTRRGR